MTPVVTTDANAGMTGRPRRRTVDGSAMPIASEDRGATTPGAQDDDGFAPVSFGFLHSFSAA